MIQEAALLHLSTTVLHGQSAHAWRFTLAG
jgi:hypothetical protein